MDCGLELGFYGAILLGSNRVVGEGLKFSIGDDDERRTVLLHLEIALELQGQGGEEEVDCSLHPGSAIQEQFGGE